MKETWFTFARSFVGAVLMGAVGGVPAWSATLQTTIDFQDLESASWSYPGLTYRHEEFKVETPQNGFASFGAESVPYQGSTALFALHPTSVITLKKNDGGLFSVSSIDFADALGGIFGYVNTPVTLTGIRADATTVSHTITTDALYGFETFDLPGFYNLTSLFWEQGYLQHQFDNISIRYDSEGLPLPEPMIQSQAVPEPATIAGLLLAGVGLGLSRRITQCKSR